MGPRWVNFIMMIYRNNGVME